MKRWIAMAAALVMVLSLCACGIVPQETTNTQGNLEKPPVTPTSGNQKPTEPKHTQTQPQETEPTQPVLCSHEYVSGACKYCGALKPSEWLEYKLNEDGKSYTLVNGCKDTYYNYKVVIPDVHEGLPVTAIGDGAFEEKYSNYCLTEVVIPNTVTTIGIHAFYYCTSLTSVIIPDSVVTIEDEAFSGCRDLKTITVGTGLKEVGNLAFGQNVSKVYISSIEAWCAIDFQGSSDHNVSNPLYYGAILYLNGEAVTDLAIPEGVTQIDDYAFQGYDALNSVIIPNSVISIADDAFNGCDALTTAEIKGGAIGADAFYGCDALVTLTLGEGVTSIGNSAFCGCGSLTSVTISDSVTSIGKSVFANCDKLTYKRYDTGLYLGNSENPYVVLMDTSGTDISGCNIHKNTKIIAGGAFEECRSLTSITLPEGLVSIGDSAFYHCYGLTSIVIPDSVTYIGKSVFSDCSKLASVTLSAGLTEISDHVFYKCGSLKSISIPNGVTRIGDSAFYDSGLQEIVIPEGVTSIGSHVFADTRLKSITLPTTLTNIGSQAFADYSWGTKYGPDHVYITSMEAWCGIVFENEISNPLWDGATLYLNGEAVTDVVIPDGVTSIGNYAFYGSNITSVTIPATVTNIGGNAFTSCEKLASITFAGTMEQWYEVALGENWKSGVPAKQIICSDGTANL